MNLTEDLPTFSVFAKGVRDSQGIDFHPITKEMWFTDNGMFLIVEG
jgi:glucose/arabinose dehydrogenase